MTTKPQGVAQRVISEMEQQRGQFETEQEHIAAVRAGGMRMLHAELSAEARRIIRIQQALVAQVEPRERSQIERTITMLEWAFRRLGLDLTEPEESDD